MTSLPLFIRTANSADLPAITAIYGHHVVHGRGSFELDAPDLAEMTRRHAAVLAQHLPYLVASQGSEVLGYAYANAFRPRPAFRFLVEDSVYIHPEQVGKGLGRALLFGFWPKTRSTSTPTTAAEVWAVRCWPS